MIRKATSRLNLELHKNFIKSKKEKQKENRDKVQPKTFLGVGFYNFQSDLILHFVSFKNLLQIFLQRGVVSDAHSMNKGLAAEISRKLGLKWTPGQLSCCIHTFLGVQERITKI